MRGIGVYEMTKIIIVLLIIAAVVKFSSRQDQETTVLRDIPQVVSRIRQEENHARKQLAIANNEIYDKQNKLRSNLLNDTENLIVAIVTDKTCSHFRDSVQAMIKFVITHERLYEPCIREDKLGKFDNFWGRYGKYVSEAYQCADNCNQTAIQDLLSGVEMLSKDLEASIGIYIEVAHKCSETVAEEVANLLMYIERNLHECKV